MTKATSETAAGCVGIVETQFTSFPRPLPLDPAVSDRP